MISRKETKMSEMQFLARGIALAGCGIGAGCALIAAQRQPVSTVSLPAFF